MSDQWNGLLTALAGAPALPGARCRGKPHLFDEGRPDEPDDVVAARHAQALGLCQRCPALDACAQHFASLPPRKRPGGVVAGCHVGHRGRMTATDPIQTPTQKTGPA
jgi:hypothetical protein